MQLPSWVGAAAGHSSGLSVPAPPLPLEPLPLEPLPLEPLPLAPLPLAPLPLAPLPVPLLPPEPLLPAPLPDRPAPDPASGSSSSLLLSSSPQAAPKPATQTATIKLIHQRRFMLSSPRERRSSALCRYMLHVVPRTPRDGSLHGRRGEVPDRTRCRRNRPRLALHSPASIPMTPRAIAPAAHERGRRGRGLEGRGLEGTVFGSSVLRFAILPKNRRPSP